MNNAKPTVASGTVTHPTDAEWMSYLYSELPRADRTALRTHLRDCPDCQLRVRSWEGAKASLSDWKLPKREPEVLPVDFAPALKWALAALLVLGLGYGIGRLSAPRPSLAALQAAIEPGLRQALATEVKAQLQKEFQADWQAALSDRPAAMQTDRARLIRAGLEQSAAKAVAASTAEAAHLLQDFGETYAANRRQDREALLTLWDRAEQKHQAEHVSLRRAVETVAVVADHKFERTDSQLGQLASFAQAQFISDQADRPLHPETQ
jgi:hypothetical protein